MPIVWIEFGAEERRHPGTSGATFGSRRYPGAGRPFTCPSPYWPRTVRSRTFAGVMGRMARRTLTFSSRTASAWKAMGGSMATRARSWNMWFWIMSRRTPAVS